MEHLELVEGPKPPRPLAFARRFLILWGALAALCFVAAFALTYIVTNVNTNVEDTTIAIGMFGRYGNVHYPGRVRVEIRDLARGDAPIIKSDVFKGFREDRAPAPDYAASLSVSLPPGTSLFSISPAPISCSTGSYISGQPNRRRVRFDIAGAVRHVEGLLERTGDRTRVIANQVAELEIREGVRLLQKNANGELWAANSESGIECRFKTLQQRESFAGFVFGVDTGAELSEAGFSGKDVTEAISAAPESPKQIYVDAVVPAAVNLQVAGGVVQSPSETLLAPSSRVESTAVVRYDDLRLANRRDEIFVVVGALIALGAAMLLEAVRPFVELFAARGTENAHTSARSHTPFDEYVD